MNEIAFGKAQLPVILECGRMVCHVPFLHPDRYAPFNVLLYVLSGMIEVVEDGESYEVHAGELLFLKEKIHHWGTKPVECGSEWCYIHFTLPDGGDKADEKQCISLPKRQGGLSHSAIEERLLEFVDMANRHDSVGTWKAGAVFFLLLVDIAFFKIPVLSAKAQLASKLALWLKKNVSQPYDSQNLEAAFNLSSKYLEAIFKEEKRISLQKYHTKLKMAEACQLLRTTLYSVGEIAQRLGYKSAFYFSRVFSKSLGTSPTEYRHRLEGLI